METAPAVVDAIDAVSHCQLPLFWRAKPDLWFLQVEAIFYMHRVRGDDTKYNMVFTMLDPESLQEVKDIIRTPPRTDKYVSLKGAIFARLADSADRQPFKLFTQLELGDRKPLQLLHHMRALAGPSDILRIKWFELPAHRDSLRSLRRPASRNSLLRQMSSSTSARSWPSLGTSTSLKQMSSRWKPAQSRADCRRIFLLTPKITSPQSWPPFAST